jgi:glycosyltransferase involved in cell wall biosynthesis
MSDKLRVAMLVNHDWRIDSRVMRAAATLAGAGYEVHVISRVPSPRDDLLMQGQVRVHEIPQSTSIHRNPGHLLAMWCQHLRVASAACTVPGGWRTALAAWGRATAAFMMGLLTLLLSLVLAPIGGIALLARSTYRRSRWRDPAVRAQPGWRAWLVRTGLLVIPTGLRAIRSSLSAAVNVALPEHVQYLDGFSVKGLSHILAVEPDVVHAHDLVTLSTGWRAAVATGCRLIYDAHELETHTNYWGLRPATHWWVARYEATLIRRCHAVVTVCDSIADWLANHYGINRPSVVLNSPDLQLGPGSGTGRSLRNELGLTTATPLAVYVGSVTIDRGLPQCIEAAALVPGLHVALVGPRDTTVANEVLSLAERLNISSRVHLVDPVPSREVAAYIGSADCSLIAIQNVCLSYYFCFPNKLLESVMGGVPVAAARLPELERFLGRFRVGVLMDETQHISIAAAIRELLLKRAHFQPDMQTLDAIRTEYGWPAQQEKLKALYGTLSIRHSRSS